jgi:hypothetical protein
VSFAWEGYLAVARELVAPTPHPAPEAARERAAISRAYYAVFGSALSLFRALGEYDARRTGDDHESLARYLTASRDHRRKRVGDTLDRLRQSRRWADYDGNASPARRDVLRLASAAITQAAHALDVLVEIERSP